MSWFKKTFLILAVLSLLTPVFVFADSDPEDPYGIKGAAPENLIGRSSNTDVASAIPELVGSVIGIALSFVGVVFFLLILYAGFLWMTAFGNEEKVTTSKSIMEHAVIGLIIVLSAYAISQFVFGALTNTPTQQAGRGCCSTVGNPNTTQTLEADCSSPSTWVAGPCVFGCCSNSAPGGGKIQTVETNCIGDTRTWAVGPCS